MKLAAFAVQHERRAQWTALGAFLALLPVAFLAVAFQQRALIVIAFPFFTGLAMLAWGVVMTAAWFGREPRTRDGFGVRRFARRAFAVYGAVSLVIWFGMAAALITAAAVMAVSR